MKIAGKILGIIALPLVAAGVAAYLWDTSDPTGCEAGIDPGVAMANEIAGGAGTFTDWCHTHDGDALHVVEAGEGEVVLFIHGFPTYWYSLQRPMEALRDQYRVVAIDGLGAGYSDAPEDIERYRLDAMARHLDALIRDLGVDKIHLVGHDWGAAFGLAYAQSRPEKIASVVGMSAPPQNIAVEMLLLSQRQREISAYVERLKAARPILAKLSGAGERIAGGPRNHANADRISEQERDILIAATSDLRRIDRHINWYRANLPSPKLVQADDYWPSREATLDVPALLVWGNDDTVFDPAFIELMQASSSNLEVLRLDGIGHAPQFEATDTVNAKIREHVDAN